VPTTTDARPAFGWSQLLSAANHRYPERGTLTIKQRVKLLWRLGRARHQIARWLEQPSNAALRHLTESEPWLLAFCVWPYIHAGWSWEERFGAMLEHRRVVDEQLPGLALGENDRHELLSLAEMTAGLRLTLDRSGWFFREGSLVFHLLRHDQRLMSVAFSLACAEGELIAYVGAIQGAGAYLQDALEVYRQLTKVLHGMRPRDFVLAVFQSFAGALGVKRLLCVGDGHRHQRHHYFSDRYRKMVYLDYDEVWREHGGRRLASGFFELAVTPALRPLDEVPSRKRAMYRRRYLMLAALYRALREKLRVGLLERPTDGESVPPVITA
jgi:uncharacterized protein VirK/YbjX